MKLISLLPFMESEEIKELAQQIIEGKVEKIKLVVLFPFMNKEDIDDIVDQLIKTDQARQVLHALPFLSKSKVKELHQLCKEGKIENCKEEIFLPFLGKKAIKEMVQDILKDVKAGVKTDVDIDIDLDIYDEDEDQNENEEESEKE